MENAKKELIGKIMDEPRFCTIRTQSQTHEYGYYYWIEIGRVGADRHTLIWGVNGDGGDLLERFELENLPTADLLQEIDSAIAEANREIKCRIAIRDSFEAERQPARSPNWQGAHDPYKGPAPLVWGIKAKF